jgi:hypothetical protein
MNSRAGLFAATTTLLLVGGTLLCPQEAHAARKPVVTDLVQVGISFDKDAAVVGDPATLWPRACQQLGEALKTGAGPWNFGLFNRHECLSWDDRPSVASLSEDSWLVVVHFGRDRVDVSLFWSNFGKDRMAFSEMAGKAPLVHLADPEYARTVAAGLLDRSPFLSAVETEALRRPAAGGDSLIPPPPSQLQIFSVEFDDSTRTFLAKRVATATRSSDTSGPLAWQLDGEIPAGPKLYAMSASGRGSMAAALARSHATLAKELDETAGQEDGFTLSNPAAAIGSAMASGYVGLRHGRSLMADPLTGQVGFYGVFVELRGAPLKGLVFYHDVWPSVDVTPDPATGAGTSVATSFSSSRTLLGWSFGLAPGMVVDRLSFVPKLGVTSIRNDIEIFSRGGISFQETFESKSALSYGLEVAAEWRTDLFTSRGWLARDASVGSGGKGPDAVEVVDSRYGIDLFIDGPRLRSLGRRASLSFLVFGLMEQVAFTKSDPDAAVKSIDYDINYVGGGVALAY